MYSSFNSSAGNSLEDSTPSPKDSAPHRSVNSVLEQHQTNTINTNASNASSANSPTTKFCPSDKTSASTYFDSKDTINSGINNPSSFPTFQSTLTSDARERKGGLGFRVSNNLLSIFF
jgi:hypothetical protein